MMSIIKAPFNFVPLNKNIFYPDWANCISQDVPFEDGESGTITLDIEACSPIFVRNGNLSTDNDKETGFSKFGEDYFVPGSSVKGMLRSVLEILSFSKLSIFNDDRYAVRDLNNATNFYMTEMKKTTYCGWLKKTKDGYEIEDCGEPGRLSHKEIDKEFESSMANYFRGEEITHGDDKIKYNEQNDIHKSAKHKYLTFSKIGLAKADFASVEKDTANRRIYEFGGEESGTIVFTGQPSKRKEEGKKASGKIYEFIFFDSKTKAKAVNSKVIEDFKFAYFDKENETKQSEDWKYWWKEKLLKENKKIPVFFQLDNNKEVCHLGLSFLYKLPYKNRIGDYLKYQDQTKMDLTECIFGRIENKDEKEKMLKGRVHIGHAFAQNKVQKLPLVTEVLSSPKASYYPIYISQKTNNEGVLNQSNYNTFMDDNSDLAGRKRYPVHKGNQVKKNSASENKDGSSNAKTTTEFIPLDAGVKFQCKIYYHNLRKAELGALLSSISFHNTQSCFHSLGMGKPLGYGKVKITVNDMNIDTQKQCLSSFEETMQQFNNKWLESAQIRELLAMATEPNNSDHLQYMKLNPSEKKDDFRTAKGSKEKGKEKPSYALQNYSMLNGTNKVSPISLKGQALVTESVDKKRLIADLIKMEEEISVYIDDIVNKQNEILAIQQEEEARLRRQAEFARIGLVLKPSNDISAIFSQLRTYLGKIKQEQLPEKDHDALFNALTDGYKLLDPNKSKKKAGEWKEKLYNRLVTLVGSEKASEWTKKILD